MISGLWNGTNTAAVVDLMLQTHVIYPDVKKVLLGNHRMTWDEPPTNLLFKTSQLEVLNIAKKWLQQWDLLWKIEETIASIKNEIDLIKKISIGFRNIESDDFDLTYDLDDYLNTVKINVKSLINALDFNA